MIKIEREFSLKAKRCINKPGLINVDGFYRLTAVGRSNWCLCGTLTHLVYKGDSPTCFCCIHPLFQQQSLPAHSYPKRRQNQSGNTWSIQRGTIVQFDA